MISATVEIAGRKKDFAHGRPVLLPVYSDTKIATRPVNSNRDRERVFGWFSAISGKASIIGVLVSGLRESHMNQGTRVF